MSGTLSLMSPWARQAIPAQAERDAIEATIPDGYTIGVYVRSDRGSYGIRVVEHGATMAQNRIVWGDDTARRYFRDVRVGIQTALGWLAHDRVAA